MDTLIYVSQLQDSQRTAVIANDQIRSLTEKLRKVETDRMGPSPGGSRVAGPSLASSTESTSEQVRIGVLGSDNGQFHNCQSWSFITVHVQF